MTTFSVERRDKPNLSSMASGYFRSVLDKVRTNLTKSEDNLQKSWKFNPATKQLVHPLHGAIAIKPHKSGGYQAVHNGASIGVFSDEAKLREGLHNYTNSLPSNRPVSRNFNFPSPEIEAPNRFGSTSPRPVAPSGPYRRPRRTPIGKDEYGQPPAPGSTSGGKSPQINQQAAKEMEAGANWSMGEKMAYYKQNLMSGLGMSKSETYFKGLLSKRQNKT